MGEIDRDSACSLFSRHRVKMACEDVVRNIRRSCMVHFSQAQLKNSNEVSKNRAKRTRNWLDITPMQKIDLPDAKNRCKIQRSATSTDDLAPNSFGKTTIFFEQVSL